MRFVVNVSLVAISLFVPICTRAQPVPLPYTWAYAGGPGSGGSAGMIFCGIGPSNPLIGVGTYSAACTSAAGLPGASYTLFGRVGAGQTGARVAINVAGVGFPGGPADSIQESWWALGYSRWTDRLSFAGVQPNTVELTVSWDGQVAGGLTFQNPDIYNLGQGGHSSATWNFTATSPNGQLANYQGNASVVVSRYFPPGPAVNVAVVRTFVLPVGAAGYVDFLYDLSVAANIHGSFYGNIQVSGQLSANFENTGKLIGLVARDALGNDITTQTRYAFANGTQISAVPELGTGAMLGIGLLAMTGLSRRVRIG